VDTQEWIENVVQHETSTTSHQSLQRREQRWKRPTSGWVKCNYDASHHEGERESGLGWIIRNTHGLVIECGMGKFHDRISVEEAECSALIWAMQAAWGLGYQTVIFEGDNLHVNQLINGNKTNPRLQHYLDTIGLWRHMFTEISF
ncbi:unnamed protein product, partial [Arabidopsis halleri]